MILRLSLIVLLVVVASAAAGDNWRRVDAESFSLLVPATWKKLDAQGIDSHVIDYAAEGFKCECDEGAANLLSKESALAEIEDLKKKETDPKLLKRDEHIEKIQGRYAITSVEKEARYVAYGGYENLAQLYVPYESGGYVAVRVFFRDLTDLQVALRIIRSIEWKRQNPPNQAVQHNDPSCHESCLRTPRASRGRG